MMKIRHSELEYIYQTLKKKGYTIKKISDGIGSDFRNHLYKMFAMSPTAFRNLENIIGRPIPYTICRCPTHKITHPSSDLKLNSDLAELVGILLGDGNLNKYSTYGKGRWKCTYQVRVTINGNEVELKERTVLLMQIIFGKNPSIYYHKNSEAITIYISSKESLLQLEQIGMICGDKTKNQVSVPKWIYEKENFIIACLRGLIDTDGSVYKRTVLIHKRAYDYWNISFTNKSKPLLDSFAILCEKIGINVTIRRDVRQIAKQQDVKKFLRVVRPIKANKIPV